MGFFGENPSPSKAGGDLVPHSAGAISQHKRGIVEKLVPGNI